jgi:hypothetical protein
MQNLKSEITSKVAELRSTVSLIPRNDCGLDPVKIIWTQLNGTMYNIYIKNLSQLRKDIWKNHWSTRTIR